MINNQETSKICSAKKNFPKVFFKSMYDREATYYSDPTTSSFNHLMCLYKKGLDYYTKVDEQYVKYLTARMNSLITLHFELEKDLKVLYLKSNIKKKLNKLEQAKEKELFEKKLFEESKEKIKKFTKDTNSNIIMIKLYLRNQRNNFIKRARNKLFKKLIKENTLIKEDLVIEKNLNMNITPIKDINNDTIRHQLMIRTKGNSNMKDYFFPTQIFFDEDKNFLFKNNINVFKKEEKFNIEEMTKNFIYRYSLSFNSIIYGLIKKINETLDENYTEKKDSYKKHCEIVSFYNMIIKDDYYRKDLIKNEIELHEENISYLNKLDDLQIEKIDKLIEIMDRFKNNNPIDNKATNEIVNDYVYGILEVFI
jgi:hypothetical protein